MPMRLKRKLETALSGWKLGKKMMAVFLDIYGNEARVLIDTAEFGKGLAKDVTERKKKKRERG